MYQGHMPDGSSIQRHSAGGAYPYVCQLRDHPAGGYWWELIGPGIPGALRFSTPSGWDVAVRRLLAVRENEDAWAFELEQLQTLAGQKIMAMQQAAEGLVRGRPPARKAAAYKSMAKASRVHCLLHLGAYRNALRLPPGGVPPMFCLLARAEVEA